MLIVNTYLDKSKIHGVGVFADEFIKKETLISKIIPGLDCIVEQDNLKKNMRLKYPGSYKCLIITFGNIKGV